MNNEKIIIFGALISIGLSLRILQGSHQLAKKVKTPQEIQVISLVKKIEEKVSTQERKTKNSSKLEKYPALAAEKKVILLDFIKMHDDFKASVPLKSDLQKLEENEAHHVPQVLIQRGKDLGRIKEMALRYPKFTELQVEANEFYEGCAEDEQYPTSLRSLCLFSRIQLAKNKKEIFDISRYPLEIKQLVLELAPFKN